jgi:hypothetical protein
LVQNQQKFKFENSSNSKNFKFEKLINSESSLTLSSYGLTVEYTTNPAWYAIQALPYLMEYPYECAEQTFNRYYANAIATKIVNSSPKIKAVFEKWKTVDTAAFLSNLQKNEELKSVLENYGPNINADQAYIGMQKIAGGEPQPSGKKGRSWTDFFNETFVIPCLEKNIRSQTFELDIKIRSH